MAPDDRIIRERLKAMSSDALRPMVTNEREGYVDRALELAELELKARETAPAEQDEAAVQPVEGAEIRVRWWHGWSALIAACAIGNAVIAIATGASVAIIVQRIFWACAVVPIALWARRRGTSASLT